MRPNWSNHGISGEINWPRSEVTFRFGAYKLIALPATDVHQASLHVELEQNNIDSIQAMSIMSQILSLASWLDDAYAILHDGFAGSTQPVPVKRRNLNRPSSFLGGWVMRRKPVADLKARRALALYREARTQEAVGSVPYAVLGFYKIINVPYSSPADQIDWIDRNVSSIHDDWAKECVKKISLSANGRTLGQYIYGCCRCAVAHSYSERESIDPDDLVQTRQLSLSLPIIKELSRKLMITELAISKDRWE